MESGHSRMPAIEPLCPNSIFADVSERIYISKCTIVHCISAQLLNINLLESNDLIADEFLHRKTKACLIVTFFVTNCNP